MYTVILISVLTVVLFIAGIVFCRIGEKDKFYSATWPDVFTGASLSLAGISAFILIFIGISLIGKKSDFELCKEKYNITVELVESYYEGETETDKGVFEYDLRKMIVATNTMIAEHRVYSKNKWLNLWYSEEVGSLKPISYETLKK